KVKKKSDEQTNSTSRASFFIHIISIACITHAGTQLTSCIILVRHFLDLHSCGAISRFACWRVVPVVID
ncbi:MAG TPA: hypothetical protein VIJ43_13270, partial [Burkholderiales bacterium]